MASSPEKEHPITPPTVERADPSTQLSYRSCLVLSIVVMLIFYNVVVAPPGRSRGGLGVGQTAGLTVPDPRETPVESETSVPTLPRAVLASPPSDVPAPKATEEAGDAEPTPRPTTSSKARPAVAVNKSSSSAFCRPMSRAVRQYMGRLEKIRTEQPKNRKIIVWRFLKASKSGLGSNMKGLVNMFAVAMATDSEFVIETDCPEFSRYYTSAVSRIEANVGVRNLVLSINFKLTPWTSCHTWYQLLQKKDFKIEESLHFSGQEKAMKHAFHNNPRYNSNDGTLDGEPFEGQVSVLQCDRQMVQWFKENTYMMENFHNRYKIPVFDAAAWAEEHEDEKSTMITIPAISTARQPMGTTLLRQDPMRFPPNVEKLGYHPAFVFGCLYDELLDPLPDIKKKVQGALRTKRESDEETDSGGTQGAKPWVLGIQLRSGRSLGWTDVGRISRNAMSELLNCVATMAQGWANNGTSSGNSQQKKKNRSKTTTTSALAQKRLYVTGDSKRVKGAIEGMIKAHVGYSDREEERFLLQPFDQDVYVHTAIASNGKKHSKPSGGGPQGDRKVVVDFTTLMELDELWVSRSSFGEVPAWIAASRRPHTFRWRLVLHACRMDAGEKADPDCSTSPC